MRAMGLAKISDHFWASEACKQSEILRFAQDDKLFERL